MKNNDISGVIGGFIMICRMLLILAGVIGWVKNVVSFCQCDFNAPYKAEIVRGVGILVPPVGAITGWIDIDDKPAAQK